MKKPFEGYVEMYSEKIYINTSTKEGYTRVLKKIDPLLCKWSSKTYLSGHTFEDIKQELSMIIIEGVNAFNPDKGVKLSTFLHTHLKNKLISKIKSINKLSNDAYSLRTDSAFEFCECGGVITSKTESETKNGTISRYSCNQCDKEYKTGYRKSREEISFCAMPKVDPNNGEEYAEFQDSLSDSDGLFSSSYLPVDKVNLEIAIDKLSEKADKDTITILRMVCLEGFSIKDAAKEVGLTGWAASMRLKKLDRSKIILDILSEYFE